MTGSSRISSRIASWSAVRAGALGGGKSGEPRQFASNDADGVNEGDGVGIEVGAKRGLVHDGSHGIVREQKPLVERLFSAISVAAPQVVANANRYGLSAFRRRRVPRGLAYLSCILL